MGTADGLQRLEQGVARRAQARQQRAALGALRVGQSEQEMLVEMYSSPSFFASSSALSRIWFISRDIDGWAPLCFGKRPISRSTCSRSWVTLTPSF